MEQQDETFLEMARRHVREAEQRVQSQARVVADLVARGADTELAERLLQAHEDFLKIASDHLRIEEEMAAKQEVRSERR